MSTFFNITLSCEMKKKKTKRNGETLPKFKLFLYCLSISIRRVFHFHFQKQNPNQKKKKKTNKLFKFTRVIKNSNLRFTFICIYSQTGSICSIRTSMLAGIPVFLISATISPSFSCTTGIFRTLERPSLCSMTKLGNNENNLLRFYVASFLSKCIVACFFMKPLLLAYTQEKDSILSMYGIILYRLPVSNICNLP